MHLPPVVAAELASGHASSAKRRALLIFLEDLPLVETGFEHWVRVGELRLKASRKGLSVSTPDAHVAQCCLDLGAVLLTEDAIFKKLKASCCLELSVL